MWPCTQPIRELGAAQPTRLNKANENFDLQKRAQPKQATCARAFSLDPQEVRSRNGCRLSLPGHHGRWWICAARRKSKGSPTPLAQEPGIRYLHCPLAGDGRVPAPDEVPLSYMEMADGTGQMAGALQAIAEAPQAVLFHCTAGKDRTGVVAALLLWLAGVSEEDILADYIVRRAVSAADAPRVLPAAERVHEQASCACSHRATARRGSIWRCWA